MINFDNSATSFPKPQSVRREVMTAFTKYGGNPGRGGHALSVASAEKIFEVRKKCASFFGAQPENVVFTQNCTMSLNMAIKGMMQNGGHIIISDYEHNAVFRPVFALAKTRGVTFSVFHVHDDDEKTLEEIRKCVRNDTKCLCCTCASNVTGRRLPVDEIKKLCKSFGICFILDAAQGAGILPLKIGDGLNFICTAGHKSLYGPSGTGILISSGEYDLSTIIEGGTGTNSDEPVQPDFMPERLECGTLNTAGILGLGAGIDFVSSKTPETIFSHEMSLCERFEGRLKNIPDVKLYTCENKVPILSFNIGEYNSQAVSTRLSQKGFALRGGLHCAGLAHRTLGTLDQGTVRFSPGAFNTAAQVDMLANAVRDVSKNIGK